MIGVLQLLEAPVSQATLHAALALLLGSAALHKLREPRAFRAAVADFALLPRFAERVFARTLPVVESALALLLLIPGIGAGPALAAAALFLIYGGAMARLLSAGRAGVDCGCGLASGAQPVRWSLVARNGVFAAAAAVAALPAATAPLRWLDGVDVVMAVAVAAVLLAGFEQAGRNAGRASDLAGAESTT